MEPTPITPWDVILDGLRKVASTDPRFRDAVRTVAGAVLADMEQLEREAPAPSGDDGLPRVQTAPAAPAGDQPVVPSSSAFTPDIGPGRPPAPADLPHVEAPLRLGEGVLKVRVRGTAEEASEAARAAADTPTRRRETRADEYEWSRGDSAPPASSSSAELGLDLIAGRAAIKAEACRWVVAKRREPASEEVSQAHRSLIARAKAQPNCYLWMVNSYGPMPRASDADAETLAGCYDALVEACNAAAATPADGPEFVRALRLVAEAQSSLRAMMARLDDAFFDTDQRDAFGWVRQQAAERGTFIDRHMRIDDPADPQNWPDLRTRIAGFRAERAQGEARQKARAALIGKIKYHAGRLRQGTSPDPAGDWRKLMGVLDDAVTDGVPASDLQLREWLLPVFDGLPDDIAAGPRAQLVLDELDRHARLAEEAQQQEVSSTDGEGGGEGQPASLAVRRVADLLRGTRIVLIGGEARPHAKRALERAFGLDELTWLSGKVHSSFYAFEPAIARPETAVVLLAIRWSSHGFGEVRTLCTTYGKPLVRLPGGYNPEQVAQQVLEQVGEQLAQSASHQ